MGLALDATAHPTNGSNLFATQGAAGATWASLASPTFSTGPGPILLTAIVSLEDQTATGSPISLANTSGLTWTKRVDQSTAAPGFGVDFYGCQIWEAYSLGGSLSTQTVTASLSGLALNTRIGALWVLVVNGVPSTEAACIGNNAGFIDASALGVNQQVSASLTPAATGSWIILGLGQINDSTVLTANSNTSAYDASFQQGGTGDYFAFGRFKAAGSVATTTSGSAVTVGSSVSDSFGFIAALEIKAAATSPAFEDDGWLFFRPIADDFTVTVYA